MAMLNIKERGTIPNIVVVGVELQGSAVPIAYLHHCVANCPTSIDIKHYADEVMRLSFCRQLAKLSNEILQIANSQPSNIAQALDKCSEMVEHLRDKTGPSNRRLELGLPRLIQTNPPRYIWNVNGKDLRLNLSEITQWGKFKNRVISELNFVPDKPKDWDTAINNLIVHSDHQDAPIDASDEQQLKITIHEWFERRREALLVSDIRAGMHIIREIDGISYYFFQSTPLIDYLKKDCKRTINSEDLWVWVDKWGGVRHAIRVKTDNGSMGIKLWGLPLDFSSERARVVSQVKMPDDF
jgi:hypothetical protein